MNETIQVMHGHRSIRKFTDQPVSDEALSTIIEAAYRGPTSANGQHVSLVVIRDPARRARISELAGGQPWIAKAPVFITVVVDFYKTQLGVTLAGHDQIIHESLEGLMAGGIDAGITLGNLITAARSLGLGIVPIGGIRREPQAMIDLLDLPRLTFPIAGLCIGHFAETVPQKPRLAMSSFRHDETYHCEGLRESILDYDQRIQQYWRDIGRADGKSWSDNTASFYSKVQFEQVRAVAARQGFVADK